MTTPTTDWARLGQFWADNDLRYDEMLAPLTRRLLPAADVRPGDRVLDVGCGCGNTTRLACRAAPEGWALGVDLSPPMIAKAALRAEEAGLGNVRHQLGDAGLEPFEQVDLVLSQLGVMFFDDPVAAFANLRRALAPGGRLVFVCWQGQELNEARLVKRAALAEHIAMPEPRTDGGPGPMSLAEPDRVREVLTAAGFGDVELTDVREPLPAGSTAASAAAFAIADPTVRGLLDEAGPDTAALAEESLRAAYAPYETPEGVLLASAAWLVTARGA